MTIPTKEDLFLRGMTQEQWLEAHDFNVFQDGVNSVKSDKHYLDVMKRDIPYMVSGEVVAYIEPEHPIIQPTCPMCGYNLDEGESEWMYCPLCGQHIAWED